MVYFYHHISKAILVVEENIDVLCINQDMSFILWTLQVCKSPLASNILAFSLF